MCMIDNLNNFYAGDHIKISDFWLQILWFIGKMWDHWVVFSRETSDKKQEKTNSPFDINLISLPSKKQLLNYCK